MHKKTDHVRGASRLMLLGLAVSLASASSGRAG
jgi:hypothetical protein